MDTRPIGTLLGRRLDLLRSTAHHRSAAGAPPSRAGPDHATALAAVLGGEVVESGPGRLVSLETSYELPIARDALATLPYPIDAERPLYCLDLETTGLATAAGTLAFLVGLGSWQGGRLQVRQLLLPDHADERALLDVLAQLLPADSWLVTYNGRSFDWPLLVARYRLHRRDPPVLAGHFDLLPVARQLWKHRLGSARLVMVEQAVCGVARDDDLPGALIPERYFSYLRNRQAALLSRVVDHNRQDIVSLALLLSVLADKVASPVRWAGMHPGDLAGLARGYARRRRPAEALRCVEAALACDAWSEGLPAGAELHRRLSADRARLLRRLGRRDEAFAAWMAIARRGGPGAGIAWLHVARRREHVLRDVAGAIEASQQAATVAELARAWGSPLHGIERDLARRLPRLRRMFNARRFSGGVDRAA